MCSKRGFYRHIRWNLHLTFCLSRLRYLWKRKKTQPTSDLFGTGTLSSDFFWQSTFRGRLLLNLNLKWKKMPYNHFFFAVVVSFMFMYLFDIHLEIPINTGWVCFTIQYLLLKNVHTEIEFLKIWWVVPHLIECFFVYVEH